MRSWWRCSRFCCNRREGGKPQRACPREKPAPSEEPVPSEGRDRGGERRETQRTRSDVHLATLEWSGKETAEGRNNGKRGRVFNP